MRRAAHAILALVALAAFGCAAIFSWQPGLASFHDDSVSYLLMAQAFSPWQAASAPVLAAWPHEKYPPLFAWVLAVAGAAHDWRWAHLIVAMGFGLSVWLLGLYAARISRSAAAGVAAAIVYALLPGVWLNVMGILSEFPYMALAFGTLLAQLRFAERPTALRAALLGALLACAMLTRVIGVALWLAFALVEARAWFRTRDGIRAPRAAALLCASALALAAWYVARPSGGDDPYFQFSADVARRASSGGASWLGGLVASNLAAIFNAWLNALVIYWGEATQPKFVAAAVLAVAGMAAIAWRARRFDAGALYVLAFLAILAAWPFPGQMYRLALPVIPLVLAALFAAVAEGVARRHPAAVAARATGYVAILPLAFCVPALFYIAQRAQAGAASNPGVEHIMEYYRIPFRRAAEAEAGLQLRVFGDMARVRASTGASDRVMWYGPGYVSLLAQRHGVPLDMPRNAADLARQVRERRVDFVYVARLHPRDSANRLGNPLAPVEYLAGNAALVWQRTAPDGALDSALFDVRGMRGELGT